MANNLLIWRLFSAQSSARTSSLASLGVTIGIVSTIVVVTGCIVFVPPLFKKAGPLRSFFAKEDPNHVEEPSIVWDFTPPSLDSTVFTNIRALREGLTPRSSPALVRANGHVPRGDVEEGIDIGKEVSPDKDKNISDEISAVPVENGQAYSTADGAFYIEVDDNWSMANFRLESERSELNQGNAGAELAIESNAQEVNSIESPVDVHEAPFQYNYSGVGTAARQAEEGEGENKETENAGGGEGEEEGREALGGGEGGGGGGDEEEENNIVNEKQDTDVSVQGNRGTPEENPQLTGQDIKTAKENGDISQVSTDAITDTPEQHADTAVADNSKGSNVEYSVEEFPPKEALAASSSIEMETQKLEQTPGGNSS